MGLLERLEKKKMEKDMPKDIQLEFESMTVETREKIVQIFKRLFIRGTLGAAEEYSSVGNISVSDRKNEILCFSQGETQDRKYYGLIIKEEMWCIIANSTEDEQNDIFANMEAIYIPSKIGKVSLIDDMALDIGMNAIRMLEGERMKEYIKGLRGVLSEDSVIEYTQMEKSWYDQIFDDENCRQLRDYQKSKLKEKEAEEKKIEFDYELVGNVELEKYKSIVDKVVSGENYIFKPVVCVRAKDEDIRCFKYHKIVDMANITGIEYYVLTVNDDVIVAGAVENKETGDVNIEKITISGMSDYNIDALKIVSNKAIAKIQEICYNNPSVKCSDSVFIERYIEGKLIKI